MGFQALRWAVRAATIEQLQQHEQQQQQQQQQHAATTRSNYMQQQQQQPSSARAANKNQLQLYLRLVNHVSPPEKLLQLMLLMLLLPHFARCCLCSAWWPLLSGNPDWV
uniref:HDC14221 n=1 Tax=Drosophila melanogaster TaxID=7227 RepID=Q6IJU3_DROME|nr:TPA_inf: HDC14221 [Drosophila melanogaster]